MLLIGRALSNLIFDHLIVQCILQSRSLAQERLEMGRDGSRRVQTGPDGSRKAQERLRKGLLFPEPFLTHLDHLDPFLSLS
jgi:hypothetical protein